MAILRRLAAIAAVLTLCAGNLAVCGGWQAAPQARMACCDVEPACPLHEPDSHAPGTHHGQDQAQADSCCAASGRTDPAAAATASVPSGSPALVISFAPAGVALPASHVFPPRIAVPSPQSPVARHLLLSVFLV